VRSGELSGAGTLNLGNSGLFLQMQANASSAATITLGSTTTGWNLRGLGTQTLTGNTANWNGPIVVSGVSLGSGLTSAGLTLSGANTVANGPSSNLTLLGGSFNLDDTTNNLARLASSPANTVKMLGGTLTLLGNSSGTTESTGRLTLNTGAATLSVTHA